MQIAVLGTGANGSCVAADLVEAGHDVTLIDQWPEHVEVMRTHGLRIEMPGKTQQVTVKAYHLCDVCTLDQKYDIVILAVKAYDTRWSCELLKPYLQPDGVMIGLQNAMTAQDMADILTAARTIGCVVELASEIFDPGTVKRHTPHANTWFGIGGLDAASTKRLEDVRALLAHVGKVSISPNIIPAKWMKVVINTVFLGFFGTLGVTIAQAATLPGVRKIMLRIGSEALEVGQVLGYGIEPIFGITADEVKGSNQLLEKMFVKLIHDIGPNARPAVLQDHIKGRLSEVDVINGLVVQEGKRLGISTPANKVIVELTQQIFSKNLKPDISNLELIKAKLSERRN